ncbi:hypothetical protein PYW07_008746 [Mythimna separata]|uniref:Uncharacterized protein n=1 Tax=Mythimna separata TaxID=271217 RepID=A0AAD7YD85_MYTSE|nr:hypothetical protein PYW07_008746 [Mythimna separata]
MSVVRSPPQSPITYTEGNRDSIATMSGIDRFEKIGGSQPDLRKIALSDNINQITFRAKRKTPDDDFGAQFKQFQTKMESIIMDMTKTQTENINKISQGVSEIKEQISLIKVTTDLLSSEQEKIKSELTNISSFRVNIEEKVVAIENEIASLKNSPTSMINTSLLSYEDFVSETQERSQREKNIIIRGIKEIKSSNLEERRSHDGEEVKKVLKMAVSDHMEPTKTIRLGKYNPDISRPIKVIFSTSEAAKLILRNKSNIKSEDIKIYTDETPYQQKYRNNLKDELKRRVAGGEKDITIKYIKGTPRITT